MRTDSRCCIRQLIVPEDVQVCDIGMQHRFRLPLLRLFDLVADLVELQSLHKSHVRQIRLAEFTNRVQERTYIDRFKEDFADVIEMRKSVGCGRQYHYGDLSQSPVTASMLKKLFAIHHRHHKVE